MSHRLISPVTTSLKHSFKSGLPCELPLAALTLDDGTTFILVNFNRLEVCNLDHRLQNGYTANGNAKK